MRKLGRIACYTSQIVHGETVERDLQQRETPTSAFQKVVPNVPAKGRLALII